MGAWHLLQGLWVGSTYAGSLPVALFVPLSFFAGMAQLTAYRVLMVWVYDRTEANGVKETGRRMDDGEH